MTAASQDLTLLIELPPVSLDASNRGRLLIQEVVRDGKKKTVGVATFVPRLPAPSKEQAEAQLREVVFIVDGSGSMGGSPIHQAMEAALFFVKDLPADGRTRFNFVMFGSSFTSMWSEAQ